MLLFCLLFGLTYSLPVDGPVKIDLPVYEQETTTLTDEGADRSDRTFGRPGILQRLGSSNGLLTSKAAQQNNAVAPVEYYGIFDPPVTTREGAVLETEGLGSRKLSVKENIQHFVSGLLQPKPIVDTIKEEEKYGNTGDRFYSAGRAIVGGVQGVSQLVNTVLEVPSTIFKKMAKAASEKLNNFGGRLIGL